MKKLTLLSLAGLLAIGTARGEILIQDDFSSAVDTNTYTLNGVAADVGGTWIASDDPEKGWKIDGTIKSTSAGDDFTAFIELPSAISTGSVYTLSATLDSTTGPFGFIALFAKDGTDAAIADERLQHSNRGIMIDFHGESQRRWSFTEPVGTQVNGSFVDSTATNMSLVIDASTGLNNPNNVSFYIDGVFQESFSFDLTGLDALGIGSEAVPGILDLGSVTLKKGEQVLVHDDFSGVVPTDLLLDGMAADVGGAWTAYDDPAKGWKPDGSIFSSNAYSDDRSAYIAMPEAVSIGNIYTLTATLDSTDAPFGFIGLVEGAPDVSKRLQHSNRGIMLDFHGPSTRRWTFTNPVENQVNSGDFSSTATNMALVIDASSDLNSSNNVSFYIDGVFQESFTFNLAGLDTLGIGSEAAPGTLDLGSVSLEVESISSSPPEIISLEPVAGNLIRIVVMTPYASENYSVVSCTDLSTGSWLAVPHSDDGVNSLITTNLAYSTPDGTGTNDVIYVDASDPERFFGIVTQ